MTSGRDLQPASICRASLLREIERLTFRLSMVEAQLRRVGVRRDQQGQPVRFCGYCGTPCVNGVCEAHEEVARLDPLSRRAAA